MSKSATPALSGWWQGAHWAHDHLEELYEKYEGDWVAIVDGQVIASGGDPVAIRQRAARRTGRTTEDVYVTFLESADAIYGTRCALV
jgi:hypothetical protein